MALVRALGDALGRGQRRAPRDSSARAVDAPRRHGRAHRGRRAVRGLPARPGRGRGRGRRPARARGRRLAGRRPPCASGWACTAARPTWPATTTAASRSTGPPGSPRPVMAARSCCRRRPRRWSRTRCRTVSALRDLGVHRFGTCRGPSACTSSTSGPADDFPPLRTGVGVGGQPAGRLTSFVGREAELDALVEPARARPARDAHRAGRHRQDQPGHRGRPAHRADRFPTGRGSCRWPRSTTRPRSQRRSPTASACSTARSGRRRRPWARTSPIDRSLLVLDNFEHVLDGRRRRSRPSLRGVARVADPRDEPGAAAVAGEQELPVAAADDDAGAALFIERARAVRPGWEPGPDRPRRGRDLPPARRPAAGHRAGGGAGRAPAAGRSATAWPRDCRCPAPGRAMRPTGSGRWKATVAWSHDLLEPDLQRLLARPRGLRGRLRPRAGRPMVAPADDRRATASTTCSSSSTRA